MKKLVYILLTLFSTQLFSQNIDSLKIIVEKQQGEEKIKTLNDLCWFLGGSDKEAAAKYGQEAVFLAKKGKNDTLLAQSSRGTMHAVVVRRRAARRV